MRSLLPVKIDTNLYHFPVILPHAGNARSIPAVERSARMMERIIGPLKRDTAKATATPASPAYHIEPKSVRARGKMRAPSAATGRSTMHFLRKRGSLDNADDAKYGTMRGSSVTKAHETIRIILFKSGLLICIKQCAEYCSDYHRDKERKTCRKAQDKDQQ